MKKQLALLFCLGVLSASFASHAQSEQVPADVLEKDYAMCMGNEDPNKDPERAQYCGCIRDSMRSWSLDEYGQVAMEGSKAKSAQDEPPQLQALAKSCISKVLGATP